MRIWVKICGVRSARDIEVAVGAGADAVGFVFAESPRRLGIVEARRLCQAVPRTVRRVAVLRYPEPALLREVAFQFVPDLIQVEPESLQHPMAGDSRILPVLHDGPDVEQELEELLLRYDHTAPVVVFEAAGRGGRGRRPNWNRARRMARRVRLILAGGLTPDNVADAILTVRPFGVDVSSGVETTPGRKDPIKIRAFVSGVRAAEQPAAVGGGT